MNAEQWRAVWDAKQRKSTPGPIQPILDAIENRYGLTEEEKYRLAANKPIVLIGVNKARQYLGISRASIYEHMKSGRILSYLEETPSWDGKHTRRRRMFYIADLDRFIAREKKPVGRPRKYPPVPSQPSRKPTNMQSHTIILAQDKTTKNTVRYRGAFNNGAEMIIYIPKTITGTEVPTKVTLTLDPQ